VNSPFPRMIMYASGLEGGSAAPEVVF